MVANPGSMTSATSAWRCSNGANDDIRRVPADELRGLVPVESERDGDVAQLRRWHHVAHQAVVRVHADVEPVAQERGDRVLGQRRHRADLHVARRRHLQVDLVVKHVAGHVPSTSSPSSPTDVTSRRRRTPWPMRWAPWSSASAISSRSGGSLAWIVTLSRSRRAIASASVCSDGGNPVSAPARSKATSLGSPRPAGRRASRRSPSSGPRCASHTPIALTVIVRPAAAALGLAAPIARVTRLADRLQRQPVALVQLGREAHFRVDHTVGCQVGDRFRRHPFDRRRRLHHGERVVERGQVLEQVAGLGAPGEPGLQGGGVVLRELRPPTALVGEFEHRG